MHALLPRATRARQETRATALNAIVSDVPWWTTKTQLKGQSSLSPGYWCRALITEVSSQPVPCPPSSWPMVNHFDLI